MNMFRMTNSMIRPIGADHTGLRAISQNPGVQNRAIRILLNAGPDARRHTAKVRHSAKPARIRIRAGLHSTMCDHYVAGVASPASSARIVSSMSISSCWASITPSAIAASSG